LGNLNSLALGLGFQRSDIGFTLAKLLAQNADHVEGHHGRRCGVFAHRSPAIASNMPSSVVVADRSSSRSARMACRAARRRAIDAAEYRPCFVRATRMRAIPSGVLAPVDMPPCILHRSFFMAADRQGLPLRVLAPHLGALSVTLTIAVLS